MRGAVQEGGQEGSPNPNPNPDPNPDPNPRCAEPYKKAAKKAAAAALLGSAVVETLDALDMIHRLPHELLAPSSLLRLLGHASPPVRDAALPLLGEAAASVIASPQLKLVAGAAVRCLMWPDTTHRALKALGKLSSVGGPAVEILISRLAMERLREIVRRSTTAQIVQPPHTASAHNLREARYAPLGYTPPSLTACAASADREAEAEAEPGIDQGVPPSVAAAMSGLLRLLRSDAHTFPPRGADDAPLEGYP